MNGSKSWPEEHLSVRLHGQPCGALWQEGGHMHFAYSDAWLSGLKPALVSQSLPLRSEPYHGSLVEAFFGNLLPEGDVRSRISRALQISLKNDYDLLEAIGGDCAGALSLEAPNRSPIPARSGVVLGQEELARLVRELPMRPLLAGESGVRLSLAGAQVKLALCKAGDDWIKPGPGGVTTHILKPPIRDLDGSVENENFCMMLADRCGLGVPACWIEADPLFYVIERYDRYRHPGSGKVERLHQEDFCQALGRPSSQKYQAEGGPGLTECFDLVSKVCTDPLRDRLRLLDWVIFNFLIGNNDAHAKNLSLLYVRGKVVLAPFYDLLSTAVYPGLDDKFAMKIGGASSIRYMSLRNWDQFADGCSLSRAFVRRKLLALEEQVLDSARPLVEQLGGPTKSMVACLEAVVARANKLNLMFDVEKPQAELPLTSLGLADVDPAKSKR